MIGEVHAIAKTFEEPEVPKISGTSYGPRDGSALKKSLDKMNNITYTAVQKCALKKFFETAYLIAWKGRPYILNWRPFMV